MRPTPKTTLFLAGLMLVAASPLNAQTTARGSKWQVEVHGGTSMSRGGDDGTAGQFPVGEPIAVAFGSSRAVPSWYFGDGAKLFNAASAELVRLGGGTQLTPLDPALTRALARRESSAVFGVRISRALTSCVAAEISVDYAPTSLRMTDEAAEAIEVTRASFISAWNSLLATGATTNRVVNSTADINRGEGHEIMLGAGVTFSLPGTARLTPYLTAGGGAVFNRGTQPSATLTGTYSFLFVDFLPVNERDHVTIRVSNEKISPFGMVGGGIEYNVGARHGIRGGIRVQMGGKGVDTVVSASPSVTTQLPAFSVSTPSDPAVQFSNNPAIGRRSSLGGALTDLRTFEGSGTRFATSLSIGYFVRF